MNAPVTKGHKRVLSAMFKLGFAGLVILAALGKNLWFASSAPANVEYFDMAIDEARQKIYASDKNGGKIDIISMKNLEVISTIQIGSEPAGLDISPDGNELAAALFLQGEIAFIDLNTLEVIKRIVPEGTSALLNTPYDVVYGRPGRLYSVGNPGSGGFDYIHVYDTSSKTELARSDEIIRGAPRLALTDDLNTLYVSEPGFSPQQIYRYDLTADTPVQTGIGPHGPVWVNTLCTIGDKVFLSLGQVWSADLSTLLTSLPVGGGYVECSEAYQRVFISSETTVYAFDSNSYAKLWEFNFANEVGVIRTNKAQNVLYVSTSKGVKWLMTEYSPTFLPVVLKTRSGIHGQVMLNGKAAPGIPLELRFYDGEAWSTTASISTDIEGYYTFNSVPSLKPEQEYYVRYLNTEGTTGRLWTWCTRELTSYQAGTAVELGNFDIADIALKSPDYGATVSFPVIFQWQVRQTSQPDNYEFDLYDPVDGDPYYYTDPLGLTGLFAMTGLHPDFTPGIPYAWEIWTYSGGGFGISYENRLVTFTISSARAPEISQPQFRVSGKVLQDLPDR